MLLPEYTYFSEFASKFTALSYITAHTYMYIQYFIVCMHKYANQYLLETHCLANHCVN